MLETGRCQGEIPAVRDDIKTVTTRKRKNRSIDGRERDKKEKQRNKELKCIELKKTKKTK
jgi:hypothetical protein